MPDTAAPTADHQDEILLLAEKVGEMSDRLAQIESELTSQVAPLDAAKASQDSALAALNAALAGIKALNFHVLDNNLGAVSKRLESETAQARAEAKELAARIADVKEGLGKAVASVERKLAALDQARVELSQKRDADVRQLETKAERTELQQAVADLAQKIEAARANFAEPVGFNPRGDWDGLTSYKRLDVVTLNGTSYISRVDDNKEKPSRKAKGWQVSASRAGGGGGSFSEPASLQSLTAGATITWDLINPVASVTLGAAANAFTFSNPRAGGTYVLILKQDSNGSRTVTWPSNVKWPGNTAPTLTTTASRADVLYLTYDGTVFYGSLAQNFVTS
jgi:hypothetical protein